MRYKRRIIQKVVIVDLILLALIDGLFCYELVNWGNLISPINGWLLLFLKISNLIITLGSVSKAMDSDNRKKFALFCIIEGAITDGGFLRLYGDYIDAPLFAAVTFFSCYVFMFICLYREDTRLLYAALLNMSIIKIIYSVRMILMQMSLDSSVYLLFMFLIIVASNTVLIFRAYSLDAKIRLAGE